MPRHYPQTPQQRGAAPEYHDSDGSYEDDTRGYTPQRTRSSQELRPVRQAPNATRANNFHAFFGQGLGWRRPKSSQITTAPDLLGAGETETEADEPPKHLPTTRILPASEPLIPPNTLGTFLFEASRLSSVVPALIGASVNAWCFWNPPGHGSIPHGSPHNVMQCTEAWGRRILPDRGDYFLAVLWVGFSGLLSLDSVA
ncbi:hypothetical protein ID866_6494 [Astraeus odoratus]|nr:hypothetical protein ID866_6494 [Astraeus odoratus]